MRCWIGFVLFLFALGALRVVACGDETPPLEPECQTNEDCDDQDDCTDDRCVDMRWGWFPGSYELYGTCDSSPAMDGTDCDLDGIPDITGIEDGRCVSGVCEENPCDDGNPCTTDFLMGDGSCEHVPCHGCNPCDWNGEPGFCIEGVCGEDPCKTVVCDDRDLCTDDSCWLGECQFSKHCDDGNFCTMDICDPKTGECSYPPDDGKFCCIRYDTCGICIPGPCYCCVVDGHCQSGKCVAD